MLLLVENGRKTAILSLIKIISGTIYCPAKCVIVTGLLIKTGKLLTHQVGHLGQIDHGVDVVVTLDERQTPLLT